MDRLDFERRLARWRFSSRQRKRFYRKMALFMRNGVPLEDGLQKLWLRASKDGKDQGAALPVTLRAIHRGVLQGRGLGRVMADWVPPGEAMMIEAGESGGRLPEALMEIVEIAEQVDRLKGDLWKGIAYPLVLIVLAFGVSFFFSFHVFPELSKVAPAERWTGAAALARDFTAAVRVAGPAVAVATVVALAAMVVSLPRWRGRWRTRLDALPPWSIYRLFEGVRFLLALSALVAAGTEVPTAIERLRRNATPWLAERLDGALRKSQAGAPNLGVALLRAGHGFPDPEIVDDLCVYGELPEFGTMLRKVGAESLEEGARKIRRQAGLLQAAMIGVVFGIALLLITGFMSLQQQLQDLVS